MVRTERASDSRGTLIVVAITVLQQPACGLSQSDELSQREDEPAGRTRIGRLIHALWQQADSGRARKLPRNSPQWSDVLSRNQSPIRLGDLAMCLACPAAARARSAPVADYLSPLTAMVTAQAARSAYHAALIRDVYEPYVSPLALDGFNDIEEGLVTGGLVRLPVDPQRFNLRVRLDGTNPIGEKDIARQASYVAARAATIGCLLDVASRVKSGPIEVTSLVRHLEYQQQLRMTNANAATDVPTHALGLAFDIAMVNTPLPTVLEIRDVLRRMSDAGDIFVIVERQQLVFHVVPQPSRLGWYSEVYANTVAGQPWGRRADERGSLTPVVTTAIASLRPLPAWAAEWWAADNAPVDLAMAVHGDDLADSARRGLMTRYFTFIGGFLSATWQRTWPWA